MSAGGSDFGAAGADRSFGNSLDFRCGSSGRPVVVGHRGCAAQAPENTLGSYLRAIELGIRIVECDVHLTADGEAVVIHDADLVRTTGVAGAVKDHTLAQIQALDAGSWKGPEWKDQRVPSLFDLLTKIRGRAVLAIELKVPGMERAVVRAMEQAGVGAEGVIIFAWDLDTLRRIRGHDPSLVTTLLLEELPSDENGLAELLQSARRINTRLIGPAWNLVTPALVQAVHAVGIGIYCWTVNQPETMRTLAGWGVDGLISDCPDVAERVLRGL